MSQGGGEYADAMAEFLRESGGAAVIDGGLATELEANGADLKDALWSARCLFTCPDLIRKVHLDYLEVGASVLITGSYQATIQGFLSKGFSQEESETFLRRSVELAREARAIYLEKCSNGSDDAKDRTKYRKRPILIAASVGSYGAYLADGSEYSGDYGHAGNLEFLKNFHRRRLQVLAEAGPDVIVFETIPNKIETQAYINLLEECKLRIPAWFGFTSKDGINVVSGDSLIECASIADSCKEVSAVGINCTPPRFIHELVLSVRKVTNKPILIYPNSGESYDPIRKEWVECSGISHEDFVSYVRKWHEAGASLIGGCCRTSPDTIRGIWKALRGGSSPSAAAASSLLSGEDPPPPPPRRIPYRNEPLRTATSTTITIRVSPAKFFHGLIGVLCGTEKVDHALDMFKLMKTCQLVDTHTYDLLIEKLCRNGRFEDGKEMWDDAKKNVLVEGDIKLMDSTQEQQHDFGVLLKQGAEGRVFVSTFVRRKCVIKERFSKKYRHPLLDSKLTLKRLNAEARCMTKARKLGVPTPVLYAVDPLLHTLTFEYVDGLSVKDILLGFGSNGINEEQLNDIATQIGNAVGKLHDGGLVHGDLTTSNMIIKNGTNQLVLIDFGLSFTSTIPEDKAVDLYVLERALISMHSSCGDVIEKILAAYRKASKQWCATTNKLAQDAVIRSMILNGSGM
uniref:Uncharacterized protein n=1 Tax=Leersia perrieri TaxID=77586 RepID=A0A0D9XJU9_9ORYZ